MLLLTSRPALSDRKVERELEMGGAGETEEQEELQPSLQTFQVRECSR